MICNNCLLIFVPELFWLSVIDEQSRYDLHKNDTQSEAYRKYFYFLIEELISVLLPQVDILDFGCGQHDVLSSILNQHGYRCTGYDPLYKIGTKALSKKYDLIIISEVIEHLHHPKKEIENLVNFNLNVNGNLAIRTKLYDNIKDTFSSWWYKEDVTHVNFFSEKTIFFISRIFGLPVSKTPNEDIVILGPKKDTTQEEMKVLLQ